MNKKLIAGTVAFIVGGIVAKSVKVIIEKRKEEVNEDELRN